MTPSHDLIKKYNVPVPRYTSYPTVPLWDKERMSSETWREIVKRTYNESNSKKGISLYIHLPFCESLCTYCGCNTRITKNHSVEEGYIEAVLHEWNLYRTEWKKKPVIRELHLGGGTPTFFKPENLDMLMKRLLKDVIIHPEREFSFEGHPNNTTSEHLKVLYNSGFRRVSYGIQDLDPKVQKAIHRIQPIENVIAATEAARKIGYTSINFDLIYGLPFQTTDSIAKTIDSIGKLLPERIAFYSYAHVPWMKPGQRGYSEADLPVGDAKRNLYELGRKKLLALGYKDVGMDHFALPDDALFQAARERKLHRNFMGYTVCNTDLLLGLGTSAISDAKYGYMQNKKVVEHYKEDVFSDKLPMLKGHKMTGEDLLLKQYIIRLLCTGRLHFSKNLLEILSEEITNEFLVMQDEGLLVLSDWELQVTVPGKAYIRNIASLLDLRLRRRESVSEPVFSQAI